MAEYGDSKEAQRLAGLVRKAEEARRGKKDRFGLPPIEKGWLRGQAVNIRKREETCEYGVLEVMEFDLLVDPEPPGVPVVMSGTYFNNRMLDGSVMDVPDPAPTVRPVTPDKIYFSHHFRAVDLTAFYPGRNSTPPSTDRMRSMLALVLPGVALIVIIFMLYFVFHILHPW